jgi:superfamily I DNA/RNA helicase
VKPAFAEAIRNRDVTQLKDNNLEKALRVYKDFGKDYKAVEISTIHQAKGSEADTVIVALDVVKRTYKESRLPDKIEEERRVWYVAMTRTKKNLIFLQPTYKYFYPSPLTDYVKLYLK